MPSQPRLVGAHMTLWPHSIGRDQPMARASERMRKHGVRHLPVLHQGQLVGIVSERDIALVEALGPLDPDKVLVEEAMTPEPYAVTPDMPLVRVVRELFRRKYGCAVVIDAGHVVGLFTTTDALRMLGELLGDDEPDVPAPERVDLP